MKKQIPFGMHLMFDAYDCNPAVLNDAAQLYDLLDTLPAELGMHAMTKPYIVKTIGNGKKDPGGWSGFVLIEESHISFHTFVKRKFVTMDVYTCKNFNAEKAIKKLKLFFGSENMDTHVEIRGKNYPNENFE